MGAQSSKKIIIPHRRRSIELDRHNILAIKDQIKNEIDDRYRLYKLRCSGWQDEIIAIRKFSLHERILKDTLMMR